MDLSEGICVCGEYFPDNWWVTVIEDVWLTATGTLELTRKGLFSILVTVSLEKCLGSKGKQHYKRTASETQTHTSDSTST